MSHGYSLSVLYSRTACSESTASYLVIFNDKCLFTFERKNLPRVSLADFPFEASGFLAAAFFSSFGEGLTSLAAGSPLISIFGGSGGGGGGMDIALGAAGASDTCAV